MPFQKKQQLLNCFVSNLLLGICNKGYYRNSAPMQSLNNQKALPYLNSQIKKLEEEFEFSEGAALYMDGLIYSKPFNKFFKKT